MTLYSWILVYHHAQSNLPSSADYHVLVLLGGLESIYSLAIVSVKIT